MSEPSTVCYAVYDPDTGTILRVGTCSRDFMAIQARSSEAVLEVPEEVTWGAYHIVNGRAVRI